MAQPPQGQQSVDPNLLRQSLRDILDDQGDFNNLLKDAIRDLKNMDSAYGKVEARLASLNNDTINTKQVNQELLKLKQKEFLETKKLQDFSKLVSQSAKDTVTAAKQLTANIADSSVREKEMLDLLQSQGDLEAIALYAAEKQLEIAHKKVIQGQNLVKQEKQVSRQLGISGNLMKIFAEKLGVGDDAYSAMALKARQVVDSINDQDNQLNKVQKALATVGGYWKVAGAGAASIGKSLLGSVFDPALAIPIIGGVVKGMISAFNYVVDITSETTKFGRQLGLSNLEARKLNTEFNVYSVTQGSILANARSIYESQIELGKALGVNNVLSKEILDTNIQLKDIAGLDEQARASIAESATITGKSSKDTLKSVLAQVVGLKQATGVSLSYQEVLGEASKLGGFLGLSFAKYPAQLAKSLVTVKAMGMNLKELDSMASSFLDFESSISKEFEAQLLTGRSINLSKARELFLNNDLAGAASEINSQVGSSADFMKMNRIQAESFAEALGMTRDQMGEMLKRQELLSKLGAKDTDNAQKQYQLALKRFGTQKEMTAALGQEAVQSMLNASNQEKIAGLMDKIKSAFADFVQNSPIVPMIERMIDWVSKPGNIMKIVEAIKNTMATVFDIVGNIAAAIMSAANFFGAGIDENLIRSAKMGGSVLKSIDFGSMAGQVGSASIGSNAQTQTSTTGGNNAIEKTKSAIVVENNTTTYLNLDSARIATDVGTGKISKAIQ
jgi:hypothetical protein